jgi:hypothetical protein
VPAPDRAGVHAVKRGEVFEVNFEHDTFPIVSTGGLGVSVLLSIKWQLLPLDSSLFLSPPCSFFRLM